METDGFEEALAKRFSRLAELAREIGVHGEGSHWEGCEEAHFGCALAKLRAAETELAEDYKILKEVFETTRLTPALAARIAKRLDLQE